jgi:hypothetical protein
LLEFYLAAKDSSLVEVRPPFFEVVEADEELLSAFVPKWTPEQWSLALFNIERENRRHIQKFFNEKQNYLFMEKLKHFDRIKPDSKWTSDTREQIAKSFQEFKAIYQVEKLAKEQTESHSSTVTGEKDNETQAA